MLLAYPIKSNARFVCVAVAVLVVMTTGWPGSPDCQVWGQSSGAMNRGDRATRADVESRLGLTRLWHTSFPASNTNPGNAPLKFVIPRDSTVAFSLTKELVSGPNPVPVPDSVAVMITLEAGGFKEVISSRERGLHGRVLGISGALQLAEVRKELLERRGLTVMETVEFVPNARVYSLSLAGHLQAMDAETGAVLWSHRLEAGVAPILGYDVSGTYIAVTHGTHIDVFDAANGSRIRQFNLRNLPDGPPIISGSRVISPGSNGRMELLTPYQGDRFRSDMGGFHGRLALAMTELENAYVWAVTDQIYISMKPEPARPVFSIPTSRPIRVAPAGFGNLMLVVEETGEVKCFSQSSGQEVWTQYYGGALVQTPVFIRWSGVLPTDSASETPATEAEESDEVEGDDPFGPPAGGANPFGGGVANPFAAGGATNPPRGNQDPFAGGAAADPFAAANPFGASGATRSRERDLDDDEDENPGIRIAPKVDVESLIGTTDQVAALLVDDLGRVQAIDMRTGQILSGFQAHSVRKILTVTRDRVYAVSNRNELMALDLRNGNRLGAISIPGDWEGVVNEMSDRVYLQSRTGQVVCFRPNDSLTPKYRAPAELPDVDEMRGSEESGGMGLESEEFNPFGGSSGARPGQQDMADPFANPFGN